MKKFVLTLKDKKRATWLFLLLAFWLVVNVPQVFAHGGEDHGDAKPKATTSGKGTVSLVARLGEYELTLKHQFLEPDTAIAAKLFLTNFKTNEAINNATAAIEIESANGSTTQTVIEKTDTAGIYNVKIPALSQGTYNIRTKLTYGGETDTATFSGVEVKTPAADSAGSGMSWARMALIGFVFALVLALFGGLIYFVWNFADTGDSIKRSEQSAISGETVSV